MDTLTLDGGSISLGQWCLPSSQRTRQLVGIGPKKSKRLAIRTERVGFVLLAMHALVAKRDSGTVHP